MYVSLKSRDETLLGLCREILEGMPGTGCSVDTGDQSNGADLHVWDLASGELPADGVSADPSSHLFLVEREDLPRFQEAESRRHLSVLVKPVTRAALAAFLASSATVGEGGETLERLILANVKLQEFDQDRNRFLGRALRDVRDPLTAISGYCGLLLAEPLGPLTASQREVVRRMQHSARRLSSMLSAVELSAGRVIRKGTELRKGDLRTCLEGALNEAMPWASDKGISVRATLEAPEHEVPFDPGALEHAFSNLIENSCKFTPKGGVIEVRGYPFFWERPSLPRGDADGTNAYRVDVRDSGAPIPVEHLAAIFEESTSLAGGRNRAAGGLGLAICRMIVAQHQGRIWAENTSSGPVFSFVLPACRSGSEQAAPPENGDRDLAYEGVY